MALTDLLNTLRGFGEGATVGAIKYPQAALLAQVMDIPYSEALKKIESQKRDLAGSKAYQAANILGSLAPALVTGGGTIPAQIAKNVGIGALGGFTANEGMEGALKDTLIGAGLGGALGTVGAAIPAAQKGIRSIMGKQPDVQAAQMAKINERLLAARAEASTIPAVKEAVDYAKGELAKPPGRGKMASTGVPASKVAEVMEQRGIPLAAARDAVILEDVLKYARQKSNPLNLSKDERASINAISGLKSAETRSRRAIEAGTFAPTKYALMPALKSDLRGLIPAGVGGAAGYGIGSTGILGEGVEPLDAARAFSILGGAAGLLPQIGLRPGAKVIGLGASALPKTFGPRAAAAGTTLLAPAVVETQAKLEGRAFDPYSQYEVKEAQEEDPYAQYEVK